MLPPQFDVLWYPSQRLSFLLSQWELPLLFALLGGLTLLLHRSLLFWRRNPRHLPLPPGPKGLPLLGNALQLAQKDAWLLFSQWGKEYGDVVYAESFGKPFLILNSLESVLDLLDKRAPNFSDRMHNAAMDIIGCQWDFSFLNYGPSWRARRRMFHQNFNQRIVPKYRPVFQQETLVYLRRLLSSPEMFYEDTRFLFGSMIIRVSYGATDVDYVKELVCDGETISRRVIEATTPGRYFVNSLPILRHVPTWFPGAAWKRALIKGSDITRDIIQRSWNDAKQRTQSGDEDICMASRLLDDLPDESDPGFATQEEMSRNIAMIAYVAGADTTVISGHAIFLALAMNPEVQVRARAEIEAVVGTARLPIPEDCDRLPYIQAIVKELSRWHTVAPLSIPHQSKEDDEYKGYFIPKGTVVIPNTWGIMHNPETFDDPLDFKPERYLKDGKLDPSVLDPEVGVFGYGRRVCPGRHFSNEAMIYMAACLLTVFEIKPPKDELGNSIPLKMEIESDLVARPCPFQCEILPRSELHASLLSE